MEGLNVREVETFSQAVHIAGIRNTGREFMTHDQEELTYADQLDWFYNVYLPGRGNGDLRAFAGYSGVEPAAYGLINRKDEKHWLTGAVDPKFQGKGYGRQLFSFLTAYTVGLLNQREVYLDVQETNERARNLYDSLGYTALVPESHDGVIVMKYEAPDDRAA